MKVLICPLNWGLGHATRCIPIIQDYLLRGAEVVIATDGHPEALLRQEFPHLRFLHLPSYNIRYHKGNSQILAMLMSLPKIFRGILRERFWINQMMKTEKFDIILADNRFGLWHKDAETFYITHQLMIKMPKGLSGAEVFVWLGHRFFIQKYNHCLIPDYEGIENLSGDLSHKYPLPLHAQFIGPLSRFSNQTATTESPYRTVGLISGPEPTRSIFENFITEKLSKHPNKSLILRGLPSETENLPNISNLQFLNHVNTEEMANILIGAEKIYCRSGYTTIMDLEALKCLHKAEFFPTPGQTEQVYLATLHNKNSTRSHDQVL